MILARRVTRWLILVTVVPGLVVAIVLFLVQAWIIYLPRSATIEELVLTLPRPGRIVPYSTDSGQLHALWLPPVHGDVPRTLWLVQGGNGSLATDYASLVAALPDPGAGYLFVDYPGYGANPGRPDPASILAGSRAAIAAVSATWGWTPEERQRRVAVLGHSLGAAAVLQYAAADGARLVVLIAPFTSLAAMARRVVGWPLHLVLTHRFDNSARLAELTARPASPPVVIIHGTADATIPYTMGQALAEAHPGQVTLVPAIGASHNGILDSHADLIRTWMGGSTGPE